MSGVSRSVNEHRIAPGGHVRCLIARFDVAAIENHRLIGESPRADRGRAVADNIAIEELARSRSGVIHMYRIAAEVVDNHVLIRPSSVKRHVRDIDIPGNLNRGIIP
ncbi:hypothetical protein D3C75_644410 [compost metagenome]